MAFTGTATIKQISDGIVRITGLSLAAAAVGVIGLSGKTASPDVRLPASFQPKNYVYDNATITLQDSVDCSCKNAATGVATAIPLAIVKTGTTDEDFAITITNTHGSLACPNQEILIRFHL